MKNKRKLKSSLMKGKKLMCKRIYKITKTMSLSN